MNYEFIHYTSLQKCCCSYIYKVQYNNKNKNELLIE